MVYHLLILGLVDPNLSAVTEDASIAYPELKPDLGPNILSGVVQAAESPFSAFSGTTARTSRSAHELRSYSSFDLLDALPDLVEAAGKVLTWLLPENEVSEEAVAGIYNDLQNSSSRTSNNVARLGKAFQMVKDVYGGKPFLKPSIVVSALLGTNELQGNQTGPWRPEPLLFKANLTTLVLLITQPWEIEASSGLLDFLDQNFPSTFNVHLSNSDDFAMALEIRTQHFILQLARYIHQINFDPDMLLSQVFQSGPTTFKGWASDEGTFFHESFL